MGVEGHDRGFRKGIWEGMERAQYNSNSIKIF